MKKYIDLEEMSNVNCASVLKVIQEHGEISRKEIARATGLSWGGMTKIVNKLFEQNYLEEGKSQTVSGAGRKPSVIRIHPERNLVIGMDLNQLGFSAYVMNLRQEIRQRYHREVVFQKKEELLQEIYDFLDPIVRECRDRNLLAVGVAMQGALDMQNGISIAFPHCDNWSQVPLRDLLQERYEIPVWIDHDPNCMLSSCMAEVESENVLLLRMDKTIGMAVALNGEILRSNGIFEIASCIVSEDGRCLESYVEPCMTPTGIDSAAMEVMLPKLAVTVCNMIHLFQAETVILTGKMTGYRQFFESELRSWLERYCKEQPPHLYLVDEEEHAVHGAGLLAIQGVVEHFRV